MDTARADLVTRRTVARYARAIDQKDVDAVEAVFSVDAELRRAGVITTGREAVADFYRNVLPTFGHMRHLITNTMAEPDGELIRAHSYFSYVQVIDDGVRFGWGDYNDVVRPVSENDGVFVEKEIVVHHSLVVPMSVAESMLPGASPPA